MYSMKELLLMVEEKAKEMKIKKIKNAEEVYALLHEYADKEQEHFLLITLDAANKMIDHTVVFMGTLNQSLVHPRDIFRKALHDNAAGIIIAHNHPSGTLEPSRADIQITQRLKEAAQLVGIELLDHVILAKNGYYSFVDEGMI